MSWKTKYNKKYKFDNDESHSIADMAKTTGIKKSILQQVYNRGSRAWSSNPSSVRTKDGKKTQGVAKNKMSKAQWSYARTYAFIMGNPKQVGEGKPDNDLWKKRK